MQFHEPSDSHKAEKEAIDVQLQEKNAEIERLSRELEALKVYIVCIVLKVHSLLYIVILTLAVGKGRDSTSAEG